MKLKMTKCKQRFPNNLIQNSSNILDFVVFQNEVFKICGFMMFCKEYFEILKLFIEILILGLKNVLLQLARDLF